MWFGEMRCDLVRNEDVMASLYPSVATSNVTRDFQAVSSSYGEIVIHRQVLRICCGCCRTDCMPRSADGDTRLCSKTSDSQPLQPHGEAERGIGALL